MLCEPQSMGIGYSKERDAPSSKAIQGPECVEHSGHVI